MSFMVGDAQLADQLPGGKFHLITAFAVMHWLADQENGLKNINYCLDDSGVFVAHIWCGSEADWSMFDVLKKPKWMPYFKKVHKIALLSTRPFKFLTFHNY